MCLICIEFQKETLTVPEALRNLKEMRASIGEVHADEVTKLVHERALRELEDLLKDFNAFVDPPKPVSEMSDIEYVRGKMFNALKLERYTEKSVNPDFYGIVNILPDDDEPLELEFEDIPTCSW